MIRHVQEHFHGNFLPPYRDVGEGNRRHQMSRKNRDFVSVSAGHSSADKYRNGNGKRESKR